MNYKLFILLIVIGTIVSWVTFGLIILRIDPFQAGFLAFLLFYLAISLGFVGTFFLLGNLSLAKIFKKPLNVFQVKSSMRHAIQFTALIVIWAFLQSQELLRWWNLLLLVLILTVSEFLFISIEREKRPHTYETENTPTPGPIQPGDSINLGA